MSAPGKISDPPSNFVAGFGRELHGIDLPSSRFFYFFSRPALLVPPRSSPRANSSPSPFRSNQDRRRGPRLPASMVTIAPRKNESRYNSLRRNETDAVRAKLEVDAGGRILRGVW